MADVVQQARLKVLVADDELAITETLSVILRKNGFEVATAPNGAIAVELARLWNPDIFLSDVLMPEMNGIEAAILIRKALPQCKILLFSGHTVASDLMHDAACRGYDFDVLTKPIHPLELIGWLHSPLLGLARVENEAHRTQLPVDIPKAS